MNRLADYLELKAPAAAPSESLYDGFGRRFEYLRLSLTDVCNFRCTYCLPNGYQKHQAPPPNLTVDEIRRLVKAFAQLGLWKIRLTGGEPGLRPELFEIARTVSEIAGIRKLVMTTNGYRLVERAADYAASGISALNISIDSLDASRFQAITGHDRLSEILRGIDVARSAGIGPIKINSVLMRDVNDGDLERFIAFVAEHSLTLRFIEVMRTNDNTAFFEKYNISGAVIADQLRDLGWQQAERQPGAGPAVEFFHSEHGGRIGVIAPYSKDFCSSCNRLRVSALGKLHLCLFGDGGLDLRPLLQSDDQLEALVLRIVGLTSTKLASHRLHEGNSGATPHLASIGG